MPYIAWLVQVINKTKKEVVYVSLVGRNSSINNAPRVGNKGKVGKTWIPKKFLDNTSKSNGRVLELHFPCLGTHLGGGNE